MFQFYFLYMYFRLIFRFRRGFKQFFSWCPCVEVGPETLIRRDVVTSRYSCSGSPDHNRVIRNGYKNLFEISMFTFFLKSKTQISAKINARTRDGQTLYARELVNFDKQTRNSY